MSGPLHVVCGSIALGLLLSTPAAAQSTGAKRPLKVFILAGQSNMQGQGLVQEQDDAGKGKPGTLSAMLADPAKAPLLAHLRTRDGQWAERDDVWVYDINEFGTAKGHLGLGFGWDLGNKNWFGPELEFGHVLKQHSDDPVLIIKTAWGGKSLFTDFRPPSSGGSVGPFYVEMLATVKSVLGNLGQEFPDCGGNGYELAGFVWWHGWNDFCDPEHAVPEYEKNLANLIRDLRRDLDAPGLPVVIGEFTGPWGADCKEPAALAIRNAQAAVAALPEFREHVAFVPTHDFVRTEQESPTDEGYHEFKNGETYFLIGKALGEGMSALLAGESKLEPGLKDYGQKPYVRVSQNLPYVEDEPWKLVCTLPYNCQFQPSIEVEAPAGKELLFNSTNPLVLYLTPTESVTTSAGTHEYEAHNWISGEGALYTIPAGVTVKGVRYRETGYDTNFAGSFECNDEDFNILWRKAARTAYLCMRDHFYDCPDRERVGFWGDGTPELNQCFYVFDAGSHRLCKELVLRKLEPDFYPGQHLEFLGEYGLWFYYLHSGDLASIAAVYEPTKTFLLETYKFGNAKTWFDWGNDSKDTSVLETCFVYLDLGTLRKMALATGHEADLPRIDARREELRKDFDQRFWKGGFYQSADVTAPDDRANALAVNSGLADKSKWDAIYTNVLSKTTNASCFFDRWVFEALCTMGLQDRALLRMVTRYRTMIGCSFTTLWEHYDRWWASWLNAFDEGSSLNHGWNPPALVLSQDIAGVRPVEPGWSTYAVKPKEAFLTSIKVVVPSIKGRVAVEIQKSASEYSLGLESPAGTAAIVGIPRGSFSKIDSISVNGTLVWNGTFIGKLEGLAWVGDEGGYVQFRAAPGTWRFVARGTLTLATPKPPRPAARPEVLLDSRTWNASASVPDGSFLFSGDKIPIEIPAANALDGDHWTGWRDMTTTQHPGQWFQVDMQERQSFDQIELDNTWAQWDSPAEYAVAVSDDGLTWSAPIATGRGTPGITTIGFPPQNARWIRITQTGSNPTYHWSLYELSVSRSAQ